MTRSASPAPVGSARGWAGSGWWGGPRHSRAQCTAGMRRVKAGGHRGQLASIGQFVSVWWGLAPWPLHRAVRLAGAGCPASRGWRRRRRHSCRLRRAHRLLERRRVLFRSAHAHEGRAPRGAVGGCRAPERPTHTRRKQGARRASLDGRSRRRRHAAGRRRDLRCGGGGAVADDGAGADRAAGARDPAAAAAKVAAAAPPPPRPSPPPSPPPKSAAPAGDASKAARNGTPARRAQAARRTEAPPEVEKPPVIEVTPPPPPPAHAARHPLRRRPSRGGRGRDLHVGQLRWGARRAPRKTIGRWRGRVESVSRFFTCRTTSCRLPTTSPSAGRRSRRRRARGGTWAGS